MKGSEFYFLGEAPSSKSLLSRALIVKSYFNSFCIKGSSSCDDIKIMELAIQNLNLKKEFYCDLSGTAFRFLALRLSREKGKFFLKGEPALLKRSLQEGTRLLAQLSVETVFNEEGLQITSEGWRPQGDYINVPSHVTSQWASALLLNGWHLKRDLYFSLNKNFVSSAYFQMTLKFIKDLGLEVIGLDYEFKIAKGQTLKKFDYQVEQDQSCLFAIAALAVLKGKAIFTNWEQETVQPDGIFPEVLKKMGVLIKNHNKNLEVSQCSQLKPIKINLKSHPDIFPVLSVLCSQAQGTSELSGLSHLAFKESNRLEKIKELFSYTGVDFQHKEDTLYIMGRNKLIQSPPFSFDSDQDHRIVMAASLFKKIGVPISIQNEEAVNKSFPDFLKITESV